MMAKMIAIDSWLVRSCCGTNFEKSTLCRDDTHVYTICIDVAEIKINEINKMSIETKYHPPFFGIFGIFFGVVLCLNVESIIAKCRFTKMWISANGLRRETKYHPP